MSLLFEIKSFSFFKKHARANTKREKYSKQLSLVCFGKEAAEEEDYYYYYSSSQLNNSKRTTFEVKSSSMTTTMLAIDAV